MKDLASSYKMSTNPSSPAELMQPSSGYHPKYDDTPNILAGIYGKTFALTLPGEPTYVAEMLRPGSKATQEFEDAIEEDRRDPHYDKVLNNLAYQSLEDVSEWNHYLPTMVIRAETGIPMRFFAKINFHFDDEWRAVRVMYLYCAGWRRRGGMRGPNPSSAEIAWYFAAKAARERYGDRARFFVVMPRESVYSALIRNGARQWAMVDAPAIRLTGKLIKPYKTVDPDLWWLTTAEVSVNRLLQL
jgi:hypothetical protein